MNIRSLYVAVGAFMLLTSSTNAFAMQQQQVPMLNEKNPYTDFIALISQTTQGGKWVGTVPVIYPLKAVTEAYTKAEKWIQQTTTDPLQRTLLGSLNYEYTNYILLTQCPFEHSCQEIITDMCKSELSGYGALRLFEKVTTQIEQTHKEFEEFLRQPQEKIPTIPGDITFNVLKLKAYNNQLAYKTLISNLVERASYKLSDLYQKVVKLLSQVERQEARKKHVITKSIEELVTALDESTKLEKIFEDIFAKYSGTNAHGALNKAAQKNLPQIIEHLNNLKDLASLIQKDIKKLDAKQMEGKLFAYSNAYFQLIPRKPSAHFDLTEQIISFAMDNKFEDYTEANDATLQEVKKAMTLIKKALGEK